MNWYYSDAGQQVGPVSEEEFQEAIRVGKIIHNTPVWNEALTSWQEYRTIVSLHLEAVEIESCSQCGNIFSVDDLIQYEGDFICVACKRYVR
jgi:formylmethanofuran dehydrogenase subunit E